MKRVLIVGGGIAGLSTAAMLQYDFDVTIVDKRKSIDERIGFIGIWENGLRALEKIGIKENIEKEAYEPPSFRVVNELDTSLFSVHRNMFTRLLGKHMIVDRYLLHANLRNKVRRSHIVLGRTVLGIQESNNTVCVHMSDGTIDEYDFVIAADGINSTIRSQVCSVQKHSYNWNVWVCNLPQAVSSSLDGATFVLGEQRYCFIIPGNTQGWVMFGAPIMESSEMYLDTYDYVRHSFKKSSAMIHEILDHVEKDSIYHGHTAQVRMNAWRQGRISFIGDAQHAVMPLLGLGGCIAMEDAFVLAQELKPVSTSMISVTQALSNFADRREHRVQHFQNSCDYCWKFIITQSKLLCSIRNRLLCVLIPIFAILRMRIVKTKA